MNPSRRETEHAFKLLGIAPSRDPKAIRTAWRALVRSYHPDLARENKAAANQKLVEINAAFDLVVAYANDAAKKADDTQARRADVARRMAAARRAEARRQAEAREAEAERKAHAARVAQAKARAEAKVCSEAHRAAREKAAAPQTTAAHGAAKLNTKPAHAKTKRATSSPAVARAAQAFSTAIASFSGASGATKHNTVC